MSVVKVVELLAESNQGWEDAARQAVAEAAKTLHGIRSIYIKDFQAMVEDDRIKTFRINAKVSFVVDGTRATQPQERATAMASAE
ncbi:MAG TPA: dodecin family protein [Stellaceae bacterium]|nr:dodecin family protein [Stellaceae bacterium]